MATTLAALAASAMGEGGTYYSGGGLVDRGYFMSCPGVCNAVMSEFWTEQVGR